MVVIALGEAEAAEVETNCDVLGHWIRFGKALLGKQNAPSGQIHGGKYNHDHCSNDPNSAHKHMWCQLKPSVSAA